MEPLIPRDLGGSSTITDILTATAAAPTVTAITTSTQTPVSTVQPISNASGPRSSPLLFIILITILGIAVIIGIGIALYCYMTRQSRRPEPFPGVVPGNELQPHSQQPTPAAVQAGNEVYGYYAPAGVSNAGAGAKSEQEAAARELYGYFSPVVSPRAGDGVVAPPAVR